jgi:hypothetical protein
MHNGRIGLIDDEPSANGQGKSLMPFAHTTGFALPDRRMISAVLQSSAVALGAPQCKAVLARWGQMLFHQAIPKKRSCVSAFRMTHGYRARQPAIF